MDNEEAVILVVGTETECKYRVADALAEGHGATEVETSDWGVRTFTRKRSRRPVVIDTTPLTTYDGTWSIVDISRAWIAANSLKRLGGRYVFVVCVATSSGPHDDIFKEPDFVKCKFSWLNLLASIFNKHQRNIMVVVKLQGTHDSGATKSGMKSVLERDGYDTNNMMFTTLRGGDINPPVKIALQQSERRCHGEEDQKSMGTLVPFRLEAVTKASSDADRLGPWGPERVIVLGRTGGGKSTLAQMLTLGKLDPQAQEFTASSSIRGQTRECSHGEGRGWYVVDTPGFGEPNDENRTVRTEEAEMKIKRYVQLIEGTYTHFIHVVKKDRIDWMEERLWEFFLQLFGEDIKENFTVVISNADEAWVEQNREALRVSFRGCESFLSAEFPAVRSDDEEWEAELKEVRKASLKELEDGLCVLFRSVTFSTSGQFSKVNIKRERAGLALATRDTKSWRKKAAISLSAGVREKYGDFRRLALILTRDDKVILDLSV